MAPRKPPVRYFDRSAKRWKDSNGRFAKAPRGRYTGRNGRVYDVRDQKRKLAERRKRQNEARKKARRWKTDPHRALGEALADLLPEDELDVTVKQAGPFLTINVMRAGRGRSRITHADIASAMRELTTDKRAREFLEDQRWGVQGLVQYEDERQPDPFADELVENWERFVSHYHDDFDLVIDEITDTEDGNADNYQSATVAGVSIGIL